MTLRTKVDENINIAFILNPASMPDFFTSVFYRVAWIFKSFRPPAQMRREPDIKR